MSGPSHGRLETRVWGLRVDRLALHSQRCWGHFDAGDVMVALDWAADQGAAWVWLDVPDGMAGRASGELLELHVEAMAEELAAETVVDNLRALAFQAELQALRAEPHPRGVAACKRAWVEQLYHHFRRHHHQANSPWGRAFAHYRKTLGPVAQGRALFWALDAHFDPGEDPPRGEPWWRRPDYRHQGLAAPQAFAERHTTAVEVMHFAAWLTQRQRQRLAERAQSRGLWGIGYTWCSPADDPCWQFCRTTDEGDAHDLAADLLRRTQGGAFGVVAAAAGLSLPAVDVPLLVPGAAVDGGEARWVALTGLGPGEDWRGATLACGHRPGSLGCWWRGEDLPAEPHRLGRSRAIAERGAARARLLLALERHEGPPQPLDPRRPPTEAALLAATYDGLAAAPVPWVALDPLDGLDGLEPPALERWCASEAVADLARRLRDLRPPLPTPPPGEGLSRGPVIPDACYRLQLHRGFDLQLTLALVDYWQRLGVSHLYLSPCLTARPGSSHGYDIVDHSAVNPELGGEAAWAALVGALEARGLGVVLDIVPNHMGLGSDNPWWLDVLAHGRASAYAAYFDIDWTPLRSDLQGRVLVPVLGDQYGAILEGGELVLRFDEEAGTLWVDYYEHRFPLDPATYPAVLGLGLESLTLELADDTRLACRSLVDNLGQLPSRDDPDPTRAAVRRRDAALYQRRLAELCRDPRVADFVAASVAALNGHPDHPDSFDRLDALLQAQAYCLSDWHAAADDINYRRFFDVNDLIALRMDRPEVFAATHRRILRLVAEGQVQGLRIDHPDGLRDPQGYFQRLQDAVPAGSGGGGIPATAAELRPLYVVVEKILERFEALPEPWAVYGTTGYEFASDVTALLVDAAAEEAMTATYRDFVGVEVDFEALLHRSKRHIVETSLASELNVLVHKLGLIAQMNRRTRDFTRSGLRDALVQVVVGFPVYRTYIQGPPIAERDRHHIDWALAQARKHSPNAPTGVFGFIRDVLTLAWFEVDDDPRREAVLEFVLQFQQYTGPAMAKGLEDTAFYRYHRLVALNDVGGDPRHFGLSVGSFHRSQVQRCQRWPHGLLTTSTHDSKRSEDVRARLAALSEFPLEWRTLVQRASRLNGGFKRSVDDAPAPSANDEYLIYQTILGVWPAGLVAGEEVDALTQRLADYLIKALREAKVHTSWINPNAAYEQAVVGFLQAVTPARDGKCPRYWGEFAALLTAVARLGYFNGLTQVALKLTSPGVPDLYQGCELWNFSLVDPDNRRPVDFQRRQALLDELFLLADDPKALGAALPTWLAAPEDDRLKLLVVQRLLGLRRRHSELFQWGDYRPLNAVGERGDHVVAFERTGQQHAIVAVPRLYRALLDEGGTYRGDIWGDDQLLVSKGGTYRQVFTGEHFIPQARAGQWALSLGEVLAQFPLAVLTLE
ncbi:MAG: malto-oligosyltrehalose synthase [Candidatus Competibacterales bacterium]